MSLCVFVCVCRSESLSAESRSVQSSPSYRLMKSRSESDLSQPESDEEGYTLVEQTLSRTHTCTRLSRYIGVFVFVSCIPRDEKPRSYDLKATSGFVSVFVFQSGRRNVDLDLAFSHKKRGKDPLQKDLSNVASKDDIVFINHLLFLSLCLSIPVWIVYLLLLGQLSPKHKRSSKQVTDGMFIPLVSSYLHNRDAPPPTIHRSL